MKHLYALSTACLLLASVCLSQLGFAQTHLPKTVTINTNCKGYYEYLPQGYDPATRYPTIIYLHGFGDIGNGSTDLSLLLGDAIPKLINDGSFPTSFTVNGQTFKFIIISPQFVAWPVASHITDVITYVKANYPVDTARLYLAGMSMGGGMIYEYAGQGQAYGEKIAAAVSSAEASQPNSGRANNIALANLPLWATHNSGDGDVPVSYTNDYIDWINTQSDVTPSPLALKTIFTASGHDAWTTTFNPNWRDIGGMNVYEWMLQYNRTAITLPVTLSNYRISAADKNGVSIDWTTTFEQNNAQFTIERSADGVSFASVGTVKATNASAGSSYTFTDGRPLTGANYYRLIQQDLNGKTTTYSILKAVINDGKQGSLSVWPNPATTTVTLSLNHPDKDRLSVKIVNTQGMVVQINQYSKETSYWQQSIQVGNLPAGQYFIQVKGTSIDSIQPLLINK